VKVITGSERHKERADELKEHFTGRARRHALHETAEATSSAFVYFEAGARNHWHSHGGGQVLLIVEGEARVQASGEPVEILQVGDTAIAPPGEKHWHGATAGSSMTHLAVTSGEITWFETP
jgi:4-carboxymuconolactone decarboxylase